MTTNCPLLRYAIVTTPSELVAGSSAALTLLAANAGASAREVASITITLPTKLWAGGAINAKARGGWASKATDGVVTFTPSAGAAYSLRPGETLLFTLDDVQLAAEPRLAYVTVTEVVGQASADSYVWLVARESGAPSVSLSGPEFIAPRASAQLHWSGPDHATFTLYTPETPGGIPLSGTSGDYPVAPDVSTTYTLAAVYTDPTTQETTALAAQWTISVQVPSPAIQSFSATPLRTEGGILVVRFAFDVVHASGFSITQYFPGSSRDDKPLWSAQGSDATGQHDLQVEAGTQTLSFRLNAAALVGADSNGVSSTATCAVPAARLLAYGAYLAGDQIVLVTAIQWAATVHPAGSASLAAPNGAQTTRVPLASLVASPPALTGPGQARVVPPALEIVGLDGGLPQSDDILVAPSAGAEADLRAACRFINKNGDYDPSWSNDAVHNNVICWLTDGIGGFSSDAARSAEISRLQMLNIVSLVDEAMVKGFLWRAGTMTAAELQANGPDALRTVVGSLVHNHAPAIDVTKLDARTLVGLAIALHEADGSLLLGDAERATWSSSITPYVPQPRWPIVSLPDIGRYFWIQLKATDPSGQRLVLAAGDGKYSLELAHPSATDNRQLWRFSPGDPYNGRPTVHIFNRARNRYLTQSFDFSDSNDLTWWLGDVQTGIYSQITTPDASLNATEDGPYVVGGEVHGYDWQGGEVNELWELVEVPNLRVTSMNEGDVIGTNNALTSPNGSYRLVVQGDGNLVIYATSNEATWACGKDRRGSPNPPGRDYLAMQVDGNLVLYDEDKKPRWSSGTSNLGPGARVKLGDDGVLRIYDCLGAEVKQIS